MTTIYPKLPPGYIWKSTIKITVGGTLTFFGLEMLVGSEPFYEKAMPYVHRYVDAEQAHRWGVNMAKWGLMPRYGFNHHEYPSLKVHAFGREFVNPVGIAAGFDKDGDAIQRLRASGLGFVEIGSITPRPQPGNPPPRVFRLLEDQALINRYGFNSQGAGPVSEKVKRAFDPNNPVPLGINLGKNKTADAATDYDIGITHFAPFCDYLVINISSPNTPGLRALQGKSELSKLLATVKDSVDTTIGPDCRRPAILLKIAPDLSTRDKQDIARLVTDKRYGIDGLIVGNTTVQRPETLQSSEADQTGGLSGVPLRDLSTTLIGEMYRLTEGKVTIVGCGGISSGEDAYRKIRAGASLIQLYTSLVYLGFPVIGKVKRELDACLRRDGFTSVSEAVGADFRGQ